MDGTQVTNEQEQEQQQQDLTSSVSDPLETAAGSGEGMGDELLDTPELEAVVPDPDAHRGKIDSVEVMHFETGSTGLKLNLHSDDASFDTEYMIFPPNEFVADINLDPTQLSEVPAEGKKQSPRQRYASVIANSDKDAEIQKLRALAYSQGKTSKDAAQMAFGEVRKPVDFDEYGALLNALLSGVSVVFVRRPDKSAEEAAFRKRLKVQRILDPEVVNKPKALKGVKRAWEQ